MDEYILSCESMGSYDDALMNAVNLRNEAAAAATLMHHIARELEFCHKERRAEGREDERLAAIYHLAGVTDGLTVSTIQAATELLAWVEKLDKSQKPTDTNDP